MQRSTGGRGYCLDTVTLGVLVVKMKWAASADTEIDARFRIAINHFRAFKPQGEIAGAVSKRGPQFPLLDERLNSLLSLLETGIIFLEFKTGFTVLESEAERASFLLDGLRRTIVNRFLVLHNVYQCNDMWVVHV